MIFKDDLGRFFELAGILHVKTRRAVGRALKPLGITTDQFGTLSALRESSGLSQRKLAAALETDTTTAMVICEGLERRGLITRLRTPGDRRTYSLALTAQGARIALRAFAAMERLFTPWQEAMDLAEIRKALPCMEKAAAEVRELSAKDIRRKK